MPGKLFTCAECGNRVPCTKLYECIGCKKRLCPACRFLDLAGDVYCEDCVEEFEPHAASRACHVCDCTEFAACPGGCSWVHSIEEWPLCSACAVKDKK